tara:strand:+ start:10554 stop:10871 length:318 start_codon:yes stop_codon:yes gene_type:complete
VLSKHLARQLLSDWGRYERKEIRRIGFPAVSPMFRDYLAGYRSTVPGSKDERIIEKTGAALAQMHQGLAKTLRLVYLDRGKCPRRAHDLALHGFIKEFESLPEEI